MHKRLALVMIGFCVAMTCRAGTPQKWGDLPKAVQETVIANGGQADTTVDKEPLRSHETKSIPDTKLPDAVRKTFRATFPKAEIEKLEVEVEDGVTVYDLEFKDGAIEKETDITADGTMLEFTVVIAAATVPAPAMEAIRKGAPGAALKRIERIEISYEIKDGKTIKLPKPVTQYAVEMEKGDQSAEIVVAPDGTVIEEPKWTNAKDKD